MARWAPQETDTMQAIATEVAHNAGAARTVIAVDGGPGVDLERVAASLVAALEQQGVKAMHAAASSTDADGLRAEVVDPFRTIGTDPGILVVTGKRLLSRSVRSLWRWSLWVERDDRSEPRADDPFTTYVRQDDPKGAASAVLDVTDPEHPRRNWADAC
ncbi:hypothetical protein DEI93_09085 [Curtobacterium sp. MCBD17_035]|uniref:hypothetical protein n=1 Tax=Curtobacterium sp. MCBD17_035 TaxID=2175673 RepID=UPI000DAA8936|nr:hypothetical protein [Curtobacterium sp. MCBD17_035]WIB66154.1 hypothetical protein DEI93_09085 [Curtobacterium sp. MCBD17_035]